MNNPSHMYRKDDPLDNIESDIMDDSPTDKNDVGSI